MEINESSVKVRFGKVLRYRQFLVRSKPSVYVSKIIKPNYISLQPTTIKCEEREKLVKIEKVGDEIKVVS